mmetsp:Transcript_13514/g.43172  ORF Transcript_13514/g.43172 Transcript_13514/m.43172 type:complete len:399 (-) Transcript_13514:445-1641(-)
MSPNLSRTCKSSSLPTDMRVKATPPLAPRIPLPTLPPPPLAACMTSGGGSSGSGVVAAPGCARKRDSVVLSASHTARRVSRTASLEPQRRLNSVLHCRSRSRNSSLDSSRGRSVLDWACSASIEGIAAAAAPAPAPVSAADPHAMLALDMLEVDTCTAGTPTMCPELAPTPLLTPSATIAEDADASESGKWTRGGRVGSCNAAGAPDSSLRCLFAGWPTPESTLPPTAIAPTSIPTESPASSPLTSALVAPSVPLLDDTPSRDDGESSARPRAAEGRACKVTGRGRHSVVACAAIATWRDARPDSASDESARLRWPDCAGWGRLRPPRSRKSGSSACDASEALDTCRVAAPASENHPVGVGCADSTLDSASEAVPVPEPGVLDGREGGGVGCTDVRAR